MSFAKVSALPAGRTRSMVALFASVALMNTAMVGASTAGTLIATHSAGPQWSGLPSAAGVLGTAFGALSAGALISRTSQRFALVAGYTLGALGGLIAFAGAVAGIVVVLMIGLALLGLGNGAAQLSRYVAAELYPQERKGFGLSAIVWAGTVGALAGPALIAPAAGLAGWLGLPELSGPLAASAVVTAIAVAATAALPRIPAAPASKPTLSLRQIRPALRHPAVRIPLAAMVAAHVAMVAVMTMTPPQLHGHGHGLDVVGWVLSVHMIGMFALSPLTGRLADRIGGRATIGCGISTLAVSAIIAVALPTAHASGLPIALFLLGYGWNLVFVGGSRILSSELPAAERTQLQGVVDAVVWSAAVLASLAAGQLFGHGGYPLVAIVAGVLAVLPLALLLPRRPVSPRPTL